MTGRTRLGLAAGAVALALMGTTAPALVPRAEAAATADAPRSATQDDKVRAAQEIGIVASPDLLILTDRNFVFALWQRATGTEVRASAQLAYAGVEAEWTQWIKTGVHDANARDQARILRDDAVARAAREAKQRAALVNNMTPSPVLLIQSDREFAFAMWENASGPKLKLAALAAYQGDAAAQQDFILTGIFTARAADQKDAIDADEDATEAEKEAQSCAGRAGPGRGGGRRRADRRPARRAGRQLRARPLAGREGGHRGARRGRARPADDGRRPAAGLRRHRHPQREPAGLVHLDPEEGRGGPAAAVRAADARRAEPCAPRAGRRGEHRHGRHDDDVDRFLRLGQYEDTCWSSPSRRRAPRFRLVPLA